MRLEIKNEKTNPLMKRKELLIEIENPEECTPSRAGVQMLLSKQISTEPEKIEIVKIISESGMPKSKAHVFIWDEKKVEDLSKKKEEAKESKAEDKIKEAKAEPQ